MWRSARSTEQDLAHQDFLLEISQIYHFITNFQNGKERDFRSSDLQRFLKICSRNFHKHCSKSFFRCFLILGLINEYSQACPTNYARHWSRYSFKNSFLQQFPRVQHNSRIIILNISLYIRKNIYLDIPPRFPSVNSSEIPLEMFSGISSRILPRIVSDILWQCPTDFSPEIDSEDPLGIPSRIFKRFFQELLY